MTLAVQSNGFLVKNGKKFGSEKKSVFNFFFVNSMVFVKSKYDVMQSNTWETHFQFGIDIRYQLPELPSHS